jgi:hypothetical protein
MKKLLALGVVAVLCAVGCENKSEPGGPGANAVKSGANVPKDVKRDTFKVKAPADFSLKQAEQKDITITMDRETNFKDDVTIKLSSDDKGITVSPSSETVKANEPDTHAKFTVTATKAAAIADHVITVTATPSDGAPTTTTFKVTVKGA